jgi:hypothetical protein
MVIEWETEEVKVAPKNGSLLKKPSSIKWDEGQASLASSQRLADTVFSSPLQKIQGGNAMGNIEQTKGLGKGLISEFASAGAQNAGPVGAAMMAGAPKFAEAVQGFDRFAQPTNPEQAEGVASAQVLASAIPIERGVKIGKSVLGSLAEKSGIKSFLAKRADTKMTERALESITPNTKELTPKEYEQLLSQKRITPKTTFSPAKYNLTESEKATATKFKDKLQDKDPVKNSNNIRDLIASEDTEVGKFLEQNNGIFNSGELRNAVSKKLEDITDVTIPEERIEKLKTTITDNFISSLKKNDIKSLWEARKEFDQQIESAFSGSPTLQKEVKKRFRKAVQEYIAENTPDGVYSARMKEMTNLFDLEDTVATKAIKERGDNALQAWIKENPTKAKVIGLTIPVAGTGLYLSN